MCKIMAYIGVLAMTMLAQASIASTDAHYQKIVSIVNYSNLPKNAQICVFKDVSTGAELTSYLQKHKLSYSTKHITEENFKTSACQVVYFPNTAPVVQNKLILAHNKPILSISDRNLECEVGSAFCLYQQSRSTVGVKVNLDTLIRSRVKIDPRVLKMLSSQS